jgi:aminoglycoside phosphotransferase (APT) family kinase protein
MGVLARGSEPVVSALEGGVSSDIWRVDLGDRRLCVKRALPRLKVAQLWEVPVARNHFEWDWYQTVAAFCPESVPKLVAQDRGAAMFVMEYLDHFEYPNWKLQLGQGIAQEATAVAVGARLAHIHGVTAGDPRICARFQTDDSFYAIRLEPYLIAASRVHPELAHHLQELVAVTVATKRALVHGDVSPKNILVGPCGPVFLDAECAWYGDPAFDIAFCLNHMLLKCLWVPAASTAFLRCFDALAASYFGKVGWENRDLLEARAARLLPGLFLARVDGKSPVEYVSDENDKERVRRTARRLLLNPPERVGIVRCIWGEEVGA